MLSHVSIGVKDLAKARSFYDAALKPLGYKCLADGSGYLYYGAKSPEFAILAVKHPVPANAESGLHFSVEGPTCFSATWQDLVVRLIQRRPVFDDSASR